MEKRPFGRPKHKSNHSALSSVEVKNDWRCTSASSLAFRRDKFTLPFTSKQSSQRGCIGVRIVSCCTHKQDSMKRTVYRQRVSASVQIVQLPEGATCCPGLRVVLAADTFEMRKLWPRWDRRAKLFIYGYIYYIENCFCKNVIKIAMP
jgi:hypothetical protein